MCTFTGNNTGTSGGDRSNNDNTSILVISVTLLYTVLVM